MAGRPRQEKRSHARSDVLDASVRLFSEHGYHGTSLRMISESSGYSAPTIYHYFGNKEDLLWDALRSTHLLILRYLRRRALFSPSSVSAKRRIMSLYETLEEVHTESPALIHMVFRLIYTAPPSVREKYAIYYAPNFIRLVETVVRQTHPQAPDDILHLFVQSWYALSIKLSAPEAVDAAALDWRQTVELALKLLAGEK